MEAPKIEFFKNILRINHFCEAAGEFSTLELESDINGPKLYLRPLDPKEVDNYNLLFFPDRKNALKFVEFEEDETVDPNITLGGALNKYGINAILISVSFPEEGQKTSFSILGYGKYKDNRLVEEFYRTITEFLNDDDLRTKFVIDKPRPAMQLPESRLEELLFNAVLLHPIFLEEDKIFSYDSLINDRTEYFEARKFIDPTDKNKDEVDYQVFPDTQSAEQRQLIKDKGMFPNDHYNKMLLKITNKNGKLVYSTIFFGDIRDGTDKQQNDLLIGFLLALERIRDEALKEHIK